MILEVLIDFVEYLRLRGFSASLADVIEVYWLVCMLVDLCGKYGFGFDEVWEVIVVMLCCGDALYVDKLLWFSVIGHAIGKVVVRIGCNSL